MTHQDRIELRKQCEMRTQLLLTSLFGKELMDAPKLTGIHDGCDMDFINRIANLEHLNY